MAKRALITDVTGQDGSYLDEFCLLLTMRFMAIYGSQNIHWHVTDIT